MQCRQTKRKAGYPLCMILLCQHMLRNRCLQHRKLPICRKGATNLSNVSFHTLTPYHEAYKWFVRNQHIKYNQTQIQHVHQHAMDNNGKGSGTRFSARWPTMLSPISKGGERDVAKEPEEGALVRSLCSSNPLSLGTKNNKQEALPHKLVVICASHI